LVAGRIRGRTAFIEGVTMPDYKPSSDAEHLPDYKQMYLDSLFANQRPHEKALELLETLSGLLDAMKRIDQYSRIIENSLVSQNKETRKELAELRGNNVG